MAWIGRLRQQALQQRQDGVEDRHDLADAGSRRRRDAAGEAAQQLAQQAACRVRVDVQVDLVEMDDEAEQAQIQRPEREVEDLAELRLRGLCAARCPADPAERRAG